MLLITETIQRICNGTSSWGSRFASDYYRADLRHPKDGGSQRNLALGTYSREKPGSTRLSKAPSALLRLPIEILGIALSAIEDPAFDPLAALGFTREARPSAH